MGLHLLELLFIVNFIFQPAFHNVFANIFNTFNKKALKFAVIRYVINFFTDCFSFLISFSLIHSSEVVYIFQPVWLKNRHLLSNLVLNLLFCLSWTHNCSQEFLKSDVLCGRMWKVISRPVEVTFLFNSWLKIAVKHTSNHFNIWFCLVQSDSLFRYKTFLFLFCALIFLIFYYCQERIIRKVLNFLNWSNSSLI